MLAAYGAFPKRVLPGDKFVIETTILSWKRASATVKGSLIQREVACEANMLITIPDILKPIFPRGKSIVTATRSVDILIIGAGASVQPLRESE